MKILMVCLGNICRSPLAQGIMEDIAKQKNLNWTIDSAGTSSFHNGEAPDPRSIKVANINNIDISHQRSREIKKEDFDHFDYIFAMDKSNLRDILNLCPANHKAKVKLFLEFGDNTETVEVPDPYYTLGFAEVFKLINDACEIIYQKLS